MNATRIAWAIRNPGGYLFAINSLRKEAIAEAVFGSTKPWRWWKRKYGLRAVKVEIKELAK